MQFGRLRGLPIVRLVTAASLLGVAGPACYPRASCVEDKECASDEICYFDGRCLARDVSARAGRPIGDECGHDNEGCVVPGVCRAGFCEGEPVPPDAGIPDVFSPDALVDMKPPAFDGAKGAYPDGEGAVLVYWDYPQDDHTLTAAIDVYVYRGEAPGAENRIVPVSTVRGDPFFRDAGLVVGKTYYYEVRSRDAAGNVDGNSREVSATTAAAVYVAPGIDYPTQIAPIFENRCVLCHGTAGGLALDTYSNILIGGAHGPIVIPCVPEVSLLAQKVGPFPPIGSRMPRSGPPFLSMAQVAMIRRWIADGAGTVYDPTTCDATAPIFVGVADLVVVSPTACRATYAPAVDDFSPPSALRYRAYVAASPGAESFALPTFESAAGAEAIEVTDLPAGQPAYVVVRAVDEAGNVDLNTVELSCVPM